MKLLLATHQSLAYKRQDLNHQESHLPMDPKWSFWIDRGGTFTDVVAQTPDGRVVTHKLLSEDPEHYDDAALEGIRRPIG